MEVIIDNIKYETTQLDNGKWTLPEEIKKCLRSCCGALNIDGNRVGTESMNKTTSNGIIKSLNLSMSGGNYEREVIGQVEGRYPAQTFINSETAQVLDMQSGIIKGIRSNRGFATNGNGNNVAFGNYNAVGDNIGGYEDTGGCSKILHKCDYEEGECDLYFYNPKVSKSERNAGCDGDEQQYSHDGRKKETETPYQRNKSVAINHHPTLKPIKLNKNILALFKTPNEQRIVYPFAGSGSEIIGGIKAGFNNWCGCEISQDYIDIALARIEYWSNFEGCEVPETTEVAEGQIDIWELL